MNPEVRHVLHKPSSTFSYVVWDPETKHAAVIDPALDFDQNSGRTGTDTAQGLVGIVRDQGLTVDWILETHAHADHVSAAPFVRAQVGGRIAIGEGIREDLKQVKHAVEIFVHSEDRKPETLEGLPEQIGRIADTFSMLGLQDARDTLKAEGEVLARGEISYAPGQVIHVDRKASCRERV